MKRILVVTFGLGLSVVLGAVMELMTGEALEFAKATFGGKPWPGISKWVFDVFSQWSNGSLFCLFLLPWALFLCGALLIPNPRGSDRDLRLIYGFILFSLSEAMLLMFFIFADLSVIPHYISNPPEAPVSAYFPHFFLAAILLALLVLAGRKILGWFRERQTSGAQKNS